MGNQADELLVERHLGWIDPTYTFKQAFGVDPLEWQVPYLWETHNCVVLKGRQVGASTCAACLAIRVIRARPRTLAAIVSPTLKQSTEVKLRAKNGLEGLGEKLTIDSADRIGLENGSRILSLPGTPKSVRGWTADLLVIDEAAFIDPDTFLAARATVATGGRIIVQSTPAGPFGHFFDLFNEAVDDPTEPGQWRRFRVSSEDVPTISPDFLASERASLGEDEYAQEYLGRFAPAGLGLVDPDRLAALTRKAADGADSFAKQTVWDRLRA